MTSDPECVNYARECVRLAGLTKDLQLRDQLLNMAREWMAADTRTPLGRPGMLEAIHTAHLRYIQFRKRL